MSTLTPGRVAGPQRKIPDDFWIPDLPQAILDAWKSQNEFARDDYQRVTRPHRRGQP